MNDKEEKFDYNGADLEAMMLADHYYKWILDVIRPYIGKRVVEVGAGVGSFSKQAALLDPQAMMLIEPSKSMFQILQKNVTGFNPQPTLVKGYLNTNAKKVKTFQPDTFIYINVFEHIKNDQDELTQVTQLLNNGGHVVIFVPALKGLFSNFDRSIDHHRRYSKKDLQKMCKENDLEVELVKYMDMPGILPWWFSFVFMKRTKLVPFLVKAYDNVCIPIIRVIETIVPVPVGKNVLIIARKKTS